MDPAAEIPECSLWTLQLTPDSLRLRCMPKAQSRETYAMRSTPRRSFLVQVHAHWPLPAWVGCSLDGCWLDEFTQSPGTGRGEGGFRWGWTADNSAFYPAFLSSSSSSRARHGWHSPNVTSTLTIQVNGNPGNESISYPSCWPSLCVLGVGREVGCMGQRPLENLKFRTDLTRRLTLRLH